MQSAEQQQQPQGTREVGTTTAASIPALAEGAMAEGDAAAAAGSSLEALGLTKGLLEGLVDMQRDFIPTLPQAQVQGLPMKEYLEVTLLPVLLEGLKAVVRERWVLLWCGGVREMRGSCG